MENNREQDVLAALHDPKPGDRFTELFAFYVYVIHVQDGAVVTLEANPPCTMPAGGSLVIYNSVPEFVARFTYKNIYGSWLSDVKRGTNIEGWYDYAIANLTKENPNV